MKHLLRSFFAGISLLAATSTAQAQTPTPVPNGTLDTWVARNAAREIPQGWFTTEDILEPLVGQQLPAIGFVTKSTTVHQGTFAAELTSIDIGSASPLVLPGIIGTGTDGVAGIPYTSRPARLQFWYRLTGADAKADSAYVGAILARNVGGESQVIGTSEVLLAPAAVYTLVSEPFEYTPLGLSPDTLLVEALSGIADELHDGTKLLIDDIQLTGSITATRNPAAEAALQIYPNPSATGEFSLASLTDATVSTAPFTVTDVTGRVVLRQDKAPLSAARGRLVDLREQRSGVYLLQLNTPDGILTRKLVIQ
ncbi:T9SS type A sorting domain-containing protein [Hymenobacter sp. HSC-4F20]|uniref:T9SS type A sorting domain-containing protein n=1 Tax=Hymenobacter sp. HSC-4F20 TaxID=2864135 RepID=UPI001C732796|nr:T9SS type A sorting domain-containing protein [Hymenobacter sp. HSC-4F20]MBX0292933.1 T9SS type A sorting domain-containing protein [Hymenobacter sp. HSC-4F20]